MLCGKSIDAAEGYTLVTTVRAAFRHEGATCVPCVESVGGRCFGAFSMEEVEAVAKSAATDAVRRQRGTKN